MEYSEFDVSKHAGKVLDEIMAWKRQEVPRQMKILSLSQVKAEAHQTPAPLDFAGALTSHPGASLIAEVKRASPSKGLIAADWDPALMAETYARNGAAAISCLTDTHFFRGTLGYLKQVKERLRQIEQEVPILRKDFIYHEYQVYEARMAGADALLLIVAALADDQLQDLLHLTYDLGMQALVEVHDEVDLDRALATEAHIVGVNNRDLRTFIVDIDNTARLRPRIPTGRIVVGESGIHTVDDARYMAEIGCDAFLVGEAFCRLPQETRGAKVREFVEAGRCISGSQ